MEINDKTEHDELMDLVNNILEDTEDLPDEFKKVLKDVNYEIYD
jgi:hypothetical protein